MDPETSLELLQLVFPWANYIARDSDDVWCIHRDEPHTQEFGERGEIMWGGGGRSCYLSLCEIKYTGKWEDSVFTLRK